MLFYGPSGSGKTTVAIDIILQESRRRYLENLRFQFGGTSVGLNSFPNYQFTGSQCSGTI